MKNYRRFNLQLLFATVSSILGIGIINIAVDPYGVINSPKFIGWNSLKPKKFSNVRLFKAVDITRIQPKTILLGSSRVDIGLDPNHPALSQTKTVYNLGLVGPNMYEVKKYFEHALNNQPQLKTVVIGLDFFMFNQYKQNSGDFEERRLIIKNINPKDLLRTTFSINALNSSIETILFNIQPDSDYLYNENGMRYVLKPSINASIPGKFKAMTNRLKTTPGYYHKYSLSNKFLSDLQTIISICKARNIEIKVFISPMHATLLNALKEAGLWSEFENWKREIIALTPVWDFSGYNSITTETISDEMKNYQDSSHYTKLVGNLIINRIFNYQEANVPADFGIYVTQKNIDNHITKIRENAILSKGGELLSQPL